MNTLVRRHGYGAILFSLIVAWVLSVIPLPETMQTWRPDWPLLVLIYWSLALPHRVSIGTAWLAGIVQDVLVGTLIGQHALSYAIVVYLTVRLHQRLRLFPRWQQMLSLLLLLTLGQLILLWVNGIIGRPIHSWLYWMPSVLGALLWPVIYLLLRSLRRSFRVT